MREAFAIDRQVRRNGNLGIGGAARGEVADGGSREDTETRERYNRKGN